MTKMHQELRDAVLPGLCAFALVLGLTALLDLGAAGIYVGGAIAVPLMCLWADRRAERRNGPAT